MDRQQFREQITQRYVAGKALDGASLDEIAEGMVNPVEQMSYVSGQAERSSNSAPAGSQSSGSSVLAWLVFILLIALALFSGFIKLLG